LEWWSENWASRWNRVAEAIDCALNRWDAFVRYASDGRIPVDNNIIERLLRPVAIGRKNDLFFYHIISDGDSLAGQIGERRMTIAGQSGRPKTTPLSLWERGWG
jgi:hypothetical protein